MILEADVYAFQTARRDCIREVYWNGRPFALPLPDTLAVAFSAVICYVYKSRRLIAPAEAIQEKAMARRIEIGFREGIRDALGEKIKKRLSTTSGSRWIP